MAIDTAAKRLSCLDFEEVWAEAIPIPDGTISQADRQHLIWSYAGILAAAVAGVIDTIAFTLYIDQARAFDKYIDQAQDFELEL